MNTKKNPFQFFIWQTLCHGTGLDNTEIVKAARPNKSKRISGFGSSLSLLCLQLLFSYTESQTPDQGVIFIILSKSNQMSCKTLHQVRLENELEFCSHSFYGGWRATV